MFFGIGGLLMMGRELSSPSGGCRRSRGALEMQHEPCEHGWESTWRPQRAVAEGKHSRWVGAPLGSGGVMVCWLGAAPLICRHAGFGRGLRWRHLQRSLPAPLSVQTMRSHFKSQDTSKMPCKCTRHWDGCRAGWAADSRSSWH